MTDADARPRSGLWRVSVVASVILAASCGSTPTAGEGGAGGEHAEVDDGQMEPSQSGYLVVEGDPRTRIGPAGVSPTYLVEVPLGWADNPPTATRELHLSNPLPGHQGGSVVLVHRTEVNEPLALDLATRTVERSVEGGRARELRGTPEMGDVAGEPAVIFDQLDRGTSPQVLRTVIFDHGGARFIIAFSSPASAFDAEVELFEDVVLESWEWTS